MPIGAQFYTIRDFCKTPEDLAESLKKVADIGYKTVQLSGVCAYDPQWMAEQLKANLGVEKFQTIVVACGTDFADALSGSYLASVKNAPILITSAAADAKVATTAFFFLSRE